MKHFWKVTAGILFIVCIILFANLKNNSFDADAIIISKNKNVYEVYDLKKNLLLEFTEKNSNKDELRLLDFIIEETENLKK